jgi:hypothetical protein
MSLMLLLVVQPQGDQLGEARLIAMTQEGIHCLVDVGAVLRNFVNARTRQEAALGSRMPSTDGLVVRVEDIGVRTVECVVTGAVLSQDEGLEEPRDVGPVPLRGAHVGHGLDRLILGTQN